MGVTTGGLFVDQHQIITIEIPNAPDSAMSLKLQQDLQDTIDAFNAKFTSDHLEVV